MEEILFKVFETYGWPGLLVSGVIGLLIFLLKQQGKQTKDNISSMTSTLSGEMSGMAKSLSEGMAEQNKELIKTIKESQDKNSEQQAIMLNTIIGIAKSKHEDDDDYHKKMDERAEVLYQMQPTLKRLSEGSRASRVAVIEFHNSKTNIPGLPFLWYDIHAEFFKKGNTSISDQVKDLSAFSLINVIKTVNSTKGHVCWYNKQDIDNLHADSPVLYDYLKNKMSNVETIVFVGLYETDTNRLIGLLSFEFDFDYHYEEITELQFNQVMQASIQIENLLSMVHEDDHDRNYKTIYKH